MSGTPSRQTNCIFVCNLNCLCVRYSYSTKTLSNRYMHLTNYSINKRNDGYRPNDDENVCQGHKWYMEILPITIVFETLHIILYFIYEQCSAYFRSYFLCVIIKKYIWIEKNMFTTQFLHLLFNASCSWCSETLSSLPWFILQTSAKRVRAGRK